MMCRSVNVWVVGRTLCYGPCLREADHHGRCHDAYGHSWIRVAEWARMDREALR